jgi:hypothetical protein
MVYNMSDTGNGLQHVRYWKWFTTAAGAKVVKEDTEEGCRERLLKSKIAK